MKKIIKKLFCTQKGNKLLSAFIFLSGVFAALLVGVFNVRIVGVLPPCPFNYVLKIHCAGCGATRGLQCLLHGKFAKAFWYNPVFVIALIFLAVIYVRFTVNAFRRNYKTPKYDVNSVFLISLAVMAFSFMIIRNFSFYKSVFY